MWVNRSYAETVVAAIGPLVMADGQQAVRLVRARAAEWGIAPNRIGMLGFSAGGMVATSVALTHDAESRPDFLAAIYAAPCAEVPVPADAPPLFALSAADDPMATPQALHLFSGGGPRVIRPSCTSTARAATASA